ncbi:NAD(P)H-hydrate dehydratase [uncultured Phascolarctobacterium sp.]|uniref:NAD(P)H-hydrate dehydratase n=1 Tax=uncultured Phascolarctobacterium sp. TaxID=512296 RepID=UPI0025EE8FAB|nr:NAD(P)H-hydrate dehydratase [uncultured Phascolarctobacterium sp.]
MKLVTAKEMKALDVQAQNDYAMPGILLMDNAAQAVAEAVHEALTALEGERVVIFCGGGNNGGDGLGAARWLQSYGVSVRAFVVGAALDAVQGDAAMELAMFTKAGGRVEALSTEDDWVLAELAASKADVLVDALLGTGFHGELEGDVLRACELLNKSEKYILAVDVPTGVNADNGAVSENAVRADHTVTMALVKTGLLLYPGREYCGDIELADISMPVKLVEEYKSDKYRLTDEIVRELLPLRKANAHKGDAGRVVICAGSPGYTGAAALASDAAVKAGAGLVSLYTPLSSRDVLAIKLTEVMVHGLLERMPGILGGGAASDVASSAEAADVLAIGPGLGTSESTQEAVRTILQKITTPVVIDADALTALAGHTEILAAMQAQKVLTPHPGEMARLTGLEIAEIEADRINIAKKYAEQWQAIVVLKGAPTVIGCPNGTVYVNSTGNSSLATGGSGDVLTGIIAGLAAQEISLQEAAICGVYLHGLAAELTGIDIGLSAGELAALLPQAHEQVLYGAEAE